MKVIYIAGSYRAPTAWEIEQNIRRAEALALEVWQTGAVALCPHAMTRYYQNAPGTNDALWLRGMLEFMRRSDALLIVPGSEDSHGTRVEISQAGERPVFHRIEDLSAWLLENESSVKNDFDERCASAKRVAIEVNK